MSTFQFSVDTNEVTIKYLDKSIGSGTAIGASETTTVKGHYQWPLDAPAEVMMSFFLKLVTENTCDVEVDWPGLLPAPIKAQGASYWVWLLLARPVINVQTKDGDLIVFSYTGPPNDPEKVTGFQISVSLNNAQHSTALTFVYQ